MIDFILESTLRQFDGKINEEDFLHKNGIIRQNYEEIRNKTTFDGLWGIAQVAYLDQVLNVNIATINNCEND